jgi:hypothetical protein
VLDLVAKYNHIIVVLWCVPFAFVHKLGCEADVCS